MKRKLIALAMICSVAVTIAAAIGNHRGDLADHFGDCQQGAQPSAWQSLDQGWNRQEEWEFWYTSQGSQMLPYDWFLALEQAQQAAPFSAPEHLAEFGFVPAPRGPCNPHGLPLGFTQDMATHQLGLSCAACHTRLIRTSGHAVMINGAPAEIHFNRFVRVLADALDHTLLDAPAWQRFVQRVQPAATSHNLVSLRRRVEDTAHRLREFQHFVAASATDDGEFAGFGRVDAFGAIFNRVAVAALGVNENYQPADAPVNYPFLWGASQLNMAQWNGSAPNHVPFGPLARNLGEAIGLFGGVALDTDGGLGFSSPVKVDNLHALEALTEKLRAPSWNEAGLPALDASLVRQGYDVYNRECRECHAMPRPAHGENRAPVVDVDTVGTDPLAARNFTERTASTGELNGRRKWLLSGERYGATAATRDLVVTAIVGVILDNRLTSVELRDLIALFRDRPALGVAGYKARPLAGIWATAPYLHNGSVPTLADLLQPPDLRPAEFPTGLLEFDPDRIGIGTAAPGPATRLDTRMRGNANTGHRYGTDLESGEKRALLEFLKSL